MKKNNIYMNIVLSVVAGSFLAGCGGGGGASLSGGTVSGIVSGSFYEGAKVCLDVNANGKCDTGEPSTTSAADGSFTLTGNTSYDIVAEIPVNAVKHEVLGDSGTVITDPVTFLAPKGGTSSDGKLIVSSISTKVWSAMKENGETLQQAKTSVANSISGIDASDLLENFNDSNALSQIKKDALQAKADAETTNIENSMVSGVINLTTLKTKMTEDVVSTTVANSNVSGLSTPNQVDALDASN